MTRSAMGIIALGMAATACSGPLGSTRGQAVTPLVGTVEPLSSRHAQANFSEIGNGATVSFIDPASGNTIATALTGSDGRFILNFDTGFHPGTTVYFVEGIKGLSMGGAPNRAGASLVRLRTLAVYQGGGWRSLTGGPINIGSSSTAIAALSNLRNLNAAQNLALMGTLQLDVPSSGGGITSKDTFAGTPAISQADYLQAVSLVRQAVAQDIDPIGGIFLRPTSTGATSSVPGFSREAGLAMGQEAFGVSALSVTTAGAGDTITLYGGGFPSATDSLSVTINHAGCPVTAIAADRSSLSFQIPAGIPAGSYPVEVQYGSWLNNALSLTLH